MHDQSSISPYPILDPQTVPITGNMMIEASAGTGKTYTITLLVLRLLLGLNEDKTPKKLPEILIVTFTNAATAELKERIYSRIVELKRAFLQHMLGETVADSALLALVEAYLAAPQPLSLAQESEAIFAQDSPQAPRYHAALNLLIEAEGAIDQAAIFTIHAFCQRLLKENALDLGQPFNFELVEDLSDYYREAVYHFWREECYPLSLTAAKTVQTIFGVPLAHEVRDNRFFQRRGLNLLDKISPLLRDPSLIRSDLWQQEGWGKIDYLQQLLDQLQTEVEAMKAVIRSDFSLDDFIHLIDLVGLKKQSYRSDLIRKYHASLMHWVESDSILPFPDQDKFSLSHMESRLTKNGDLRRMPERLYQLFTDLESLHTIPIICCHYAGYRVSEVLQQMKQEAHILGFDDLLSQLDQKSLTATEGFLEALHLRYRAVLIDEFQDTDHQQLAIFSRLFFDYPEIPFVMIGDPKQSIYRFRGADIHSYLGIKAHITEIYTLNTNYRSGELQVAAVNRLFGLRAAINPPFIEKNIPFIEIKTPASAAETQLLLPNQPASGITFLEYQPAPVEGEIDAEEKEDEAKKDEAKDANSVKSSKSPKSLKSTKALTLNNSDFQEQMAAATAQEIVTLLTEGVLKSEDGVRAISPEDITILVRSGYEADIIRNALRKVGVNAVYLSEKSSIFDAGNSIALDLYLFLYSLLFMHDRKKVMQSIGSLLYGLSVAEYEALMSDPDAFENLLTERYQLREIWEKQGILAMIRTFMVRENRLAKLLKLENGERYASDLFHLAEILQRESFSNGEALLLWLHDKIFNVEGKQQEKIRLESDFKTLQIMTIHKSKGLEFPIVFLPFALFKGRTEKGGIYIDEAKNRRYIYPEESTPEIETYFLKENLAEDIRLLYVALTRAKFHTYVGFTRALDKKAYQDNALSYLMGIGDRDEDLSRFFEAAIAHRPFSEEDLKAPQSIRLNLINEQLSPREPAQFKRHLAPLWRFTSFSNLSYNAKSSTPIPQLLDDEVEIDIQSDRDSDRGSDLDLAPSSTISSWEMADEPIVLERFSHFPKGAITGNFIHDLLERYQPTQLEDRQLLTRLVEENFTHLVSAADLPILVEELQLWLTSIFNADLSLSQNLAMILEGDRKVRELEFIFPINQRIDAHSFNHLLNQQQRREVESALDFERLSGFLRGFIDLFFEVDGKFYVADYKSNYLGPLPEDYNQDTMQRSIDHAYYDLQYLLYTVAAVKFLQNQRPDFDYERDFGGVYYLYLRGMVPEGASGIYYIKPDYALIESLMKLLGLDRAEDSFSEESVEEMEQDQLMDEAEMDEEDQ